MLYDRREEIRFAEMSKIIEKKLKNRKCYDDDENAGKR